MLRGSVLFCVGACVVGCSAPQPRDASPRPADASPRPAAPVAVASPGKVEAIQGERSAQRAARPVADEIAADPLAYLRRVQDRCAALRQYTLTFTRTERRGLFHAMQGPERIRCWYRREPFSVRMKWLDESVKYGESSYVAGWFGDRVRFIPRRGFLGLAPTLTRVSLHTPVLFGEARYPLTNFGLERVMQRLLAAIDSAAGAETIRYEGRVALDEPPCQAHRFVVTVPEHVSDTPISEVYVDAASGLLAALRLYSQPGRLEAAYTYGEIETDVRLDDGDFLLAGERLDEAHGGFEASDGEPAGADE